MSNSELEGVTPERLQEMRDRVAAVVGEYLDETHGTVLVEISIHGADERMLVCIDALVDAQPRHQQCTDDCRIYDVAKTPAYRPGSVQVVGFGRHRKACECAEPGQ